MNRSINSRSTRAAVAASFFAAAAFSLGSAARAGAPAAAVSAPVTATCTVGRRDISSFMYSTAFANGVSVAYAARGSRAVSSVNVRIDYDGRSTVVTDAFPLSGDAPVTRSYKAIDGFAYSGRNARCEIAGVGFADGTTWSPDSVAAR